MLNIDQLIKESLKAKKTVDLKVYRNLKADILSFKTQKNAPEYNEAAEIKILQKYAKKLEDSVVEFTKAERQDLVQECNEELEVLKTLLPKPIDKIDIYEELRYWAEENQYVEDEIAYEIKIPKKEMGVAIKYLKSKFPSADGRLLSEVVKENLE